MIELEPYHNDTTPISQTDITDLIRDMARCAVNLRDTGELDQARGVVRAKRILDEWWDKRRLDKPT